MEFIMSYQIDVNWDEEAGVWCAVCDEIPVALESNSFDALIERVKIAAYEILELNGKENDLLMNNNVVLRHKFVGDARRARIYPCRPRRPAISDM